MVRPALIAVLKALVTGDVPPDVVALFPVEVRQAFGVVKTWLLSLTRLQRRMLMIKIWRGGMTPEELANEPSEAAIQKMVERWMDRHPEVET